MKRQIVLIALILGYSAAVYSQKTEFTYQGNVKVGGSLTSVSTTVSYDFTFRLCTSDTASCASAPVLIGIDPHPGVPVTDGVFTVKLNFSAANAFDGSARWLEIGIKPTRDPGGYQALSPRQRLMSTPYAIKSKNTDSLGGIAASQYHQTNWNGSGLATLNAGNITTGTLAIVNGGTDSATKNFVDLATDRTSNCGNKAFAGNLTVNVNVGIGTSPTQKLLEVNGEIKTSDAVTGPRTTMSLKTASIVPGPISTTIPGLSQTIKSK